MDLPLNRNPANIMHIDLNSCFASTEQQANPLLRGKPVAVAAYNSPNGCIVSPSIEAKRYGIKTGMPVRDGRMLCKDLIVRQSDPNKYRSVHDKFKTLFREYSPAVTPKSIDEAVIDFSGTQHLKRNLREVGREIKDRIRSEIGEWLSCNVGIAPNRFLAKLAASLHKPDGLDVITHENLEEVYRNVELLDLNGINVHYQARLNVHAIFTPTQFLQASLQTLQKQVFQSIVGYYWYMKLRGWETDAIDFKRKSFGKQYALKQPTSDPQQISKFMMKLCEMMGRRLRRAESIAQGVHVACVYSDRTYWHQGKTFGNRLSATLEFYKKAQLLLNNQPEKKVITHLSVSCFDLLPDTPEQPSLFEPDGSKLHRAGTAMDKINDRYGEFIITPAIMMGMENVVLDRISFGNIRELEDLYAQ